MTQHYSSGLSTKVLAGERLSYEDGLTLLTTRDLLELQPLAQAVRVRKNPGKTVTYVVDTNLNYTNLCDAYCSFCAFYRTDPNDPSAYTYTVEQIMDKIAMAAKRGIRTVLMQGGLNKNLPFDYYLEMVRSSLERFPDITPHFWSAPEVSTMCQVSGLSKKQVMQELWNVGQRTMPGGGSEILANRVKQEVSRFSPKDTWEEWSEVHLAAHEVGFLTTATMMYGHLESPEEIVESLVHIRNIQDLADKRGNSGGFTAFIPWSFKRSNTALGKKVTKEAGPNQYLRIIALSRIMLDNIPHIQASWFSEGKKTGQMALRFGADDFGGTLFDENVMLAAGFYNRVTEKGIRSLIRDAGYTPTERLTNYQIVRTFECHDDELP